MYVHPDYNYKVIHQFSIMTVVWGIVGMLVGVVIAAQLTWSGLNPPGLEWFHFGRLRPLHNLDLGLNTSLLTGD
jgi:cytochrome c oxidase cbb3-type subunit 1